MANQGIKNKIFAISPYIEIFTRKIYWNYPNLFSKFNVNNKSARLPSQLKDFNKVLKYLEDESIGDGSLMVLHSSFEDLESTGLSPKKVIEILLNFLGENGTLAVNSARKFKEEKSGEYLTQDLSNVVTEYDTKKTRVWTGALPMYLLRHSQAEISQFPINPMVAVGKLAKEMMKNNLQGDLKSCGVGSSWEFCVKNNAVIVGIGIDLTHSLTIMHVAEDTNEKWPIKNWYRNRKFSITHNGEKNEITVLERKPNWGTLHFAERTLCKDLIDNGILKVKNIDGVQIEYLYAKKLINFLNSKNERGYPYFGINKKNKNEN